MVTWKRIPTEYLHKPKTLFKEETLEMLSLKSETGDRFPAVTA